MHRVYIYLSYRGSHEPKPITFSRFVSRAHRGTSLYSGPPFILEIYKKCPDKKDVNSYFLGLVGGIQDALKCMPKVTSFQGVWDRRVLLHSGTSLKGHR